MKHETEINLNVIMCFSVIAYVHMYTQSSFSKQLI